MINVLITLLTVSLIFVGCGDTAQTPVKQIEPIVKEAPKSAKGIFTAGDDQTVLEGSNALLSISVLDPDKEFNEQVWKIGDDVLSTAAEFEAYLGEGKHEITLEAIDSDGNVYSDTIVIIVKKEDEKNSPPSAQNISFSTDEDSTYKMALLGSDTDGDDLNYLFVSYPTHGKLRGSAANLYYTPSANYHGSDSFHYKTNDGLIDSALATVTITVNSVNDIPTATAQTITLLEDGSKNIVLSADDIENDSLTFTYTTPSHGTFDGTTYTPEAHYFGSDSFTFTANDGKEDSLPATLSIMIGTINDTPTFTSTPIQAVDEDVQYLYAISTNDIDSDAVSLTLTTAPSWLTLSGSTLSGTPQNGDVGTHPIMITATDGKVEVTQTFNITVSNVNDIPTGVDDIVTTLEDTPILIDVLANDTDDDDDILSIATISQPSHGTVEIAGTKILYTPELDYHDNDTFTYQPKDSVNGNWTTVIVEVTSVDDKAIFSSIPITQAVEGEEYNYAIVASDVDNNITLSMGANTPDWLSLNNNILSGMAPSGQADAVYAIQVIANSIDQNFTITIKDENFSPEFTNTAIMIDTHEDNNSISGNFTARDNDGDNYYFTTDSNLTGFTLNLDGTFDLNLSSAFYQALQEDENISDTVLVSVIDTVGASDEQNLTIMIEGKNDAPVAYHDTNSTDEDSNKTFNILANDKDIDHGAILTLVEVNATEGNITFTTDGNLTFSPIGTFDGLIQDEEHNVTLTYTMQDEHNATSESNITMTIIGIDDAVIIAPITVDDANLSVGSGTISGAILASDLDTTVTYHDSNTSNGFDINATGHYTFTPPTGIYDYLAEGESTLLTIPIMIGAVTQDININIIGKNDAPIFPNIPAMTIPEDFLLNFRFIATDKDDNDILTFSKTGSLTGFTLEDNGTFIFDASDDMYQSLNLGENNMQSIPITVTDNTETVSKNFVIQVEGKNDAPVAYHDTNSTDEDSNKTFNILANDRDIDHGATLTLVEVNATEGNFTFTPDGNLTFSPIGFFDTLTQDEEHNVTLTYTMQDEHNATAFADINITITGLNDAPTVDSINLITINENIATGTGQIVASDAENSPLTFDSNSTLIVIDNNGTYTFDTNSDYNKLPDGETKTIPIMISISDGENSITQEINVTITGVNTPPISDIGMENITITHGETLFFDASSSSDIDGNITEFKWLEGINLRTYDKTFSDNTFSVGTHTIYLVVTDDKNATDTDMLIITVNEADIGESTFIPHTVTKNAIKSEWLEMVDLDKDGDLDILSASTGNGEAEVAWYENRGDNNTFHEHIITENANSPESIKAADMNGDNHLDVLYSTYDEGVIQCINDGSQNFNCTAISNSIGDLTYIEIADINDDGKLDIISASWNKNRVDWYENDGNATYSTSYKINTTASKHAISLHIVDFNKDGNLDVVAAANEDNALYWYKKNQPTGFIEHTITEDINGVFSVDVADINNDGYDDIIAASNSDGKVYWYKSTQSTSPTFGIALEIATLTNVYYASGVDMDNDGDIDILSASSKTGGKIAWYENIGEDSNFTEHIIASGVDNVIRVYPADIDNDGNMDVVAGDKAGNVIFYENPTPTDIKIVPKTGKTSTEAGSDRDYTKTGDIVTDVYTGLMWEDSSSSSEMKYNDAVIYCNGLTLDTLSNWRLPTLNELYFLTDKREGNPTIDSIFEQVGNKYVSNERISTFVSYVDFTNATEAYKFELLSQDNYSVRCVSGDKITFKLIRDDSNVAEEVVIDDKHAIMWQDNSEAKTATATFADAQAYCDNLNSNNFAGHTTGWRLPTINELYTIVDKADGKFPRVHDVFQNTASELYWSSTLKLDANYYTLSFSTGHEDVGGKAPSEELNIRCVRDIP